MSKTQKAVFDLLEAGSNQTADSMAHELGKSSKTVYRALKSLKEKDLIERLGSDSRGMWLIK